MINVLNVLKVLLLSSALLSAAPTPSAVLDTPIEEACDFSSTYSGDSVWHFMFAGNVAPTAAEILSAAQTQVRKASSLGWKCASCEGSVVQFCKKLVDQAVTYTNYGVSILPGFCGKTGRQIHDHAAEVGEQNGVDIVVLHPDGSPVGFDETGLCWWFVQVSGDYEVPIGCHDENCD